MPTSQDRILTTHVGSLVRPPRIEPIHRGDRQRGRSRSSRVRSLLANSVADVVKRQQQAGVDVVSDGEFGKFRSWSFYVLDRLGGIEERAVEAARGAGRDQQMFPEFYAEYFPTQKLPKRGTVVCVGPLTYKGHAAVQRISKSQGRFERRGGRRCLLAGGRAGERHAAAQERILQGRRRVFVQARRGLREEYKAIVDAGLTVQIDDAFLPYMYDVALPPISSSNIGSGRRSASSAQSRARGIARGEASATTSAGAALTRRMSPTCR